LAVASSALVSEVPVTSTLVTSAQEAEATSNSTTTGAPAQQTTSDASALSLGTASGAVLAAMLLFAALLV
jgi:hypothetical protein